VELDAGCSEAWALLASLVQSGLQAPPQVGLQQARAPPAASPSPRARGLLQDVLSLPLEAAQEVQRLLELAAAGGARAHPPPPAPPALWGLEEPGAQLGAPLHLRLSGVQARTALWDAAAPGADALTRAAALAAARASCQRAAAAEGEGGPPASAGIARALGRIALLEGEPELAERLLQRACSLDEEEASAHVWLALAAVRCTPQRCAAARAAAQAALARGATADDEVAAEGLLMAAAALRALGEVGTAAALLRGALKGSSGGASLTPALARLRHECQAMLDETVVMGM